MGFANLIPCAMISGHIIYVPVRSERDPYTAHKVMEKKRSEERLNLPFRYRSL